MRSGKLNEEFGGLFNTEDLMGPEAGGTSPRHEMRPFSVQELLDVGDVQRRFAPRHAGETQVLGLTRLRFGELRGLRVADALEVPYPRSSGEPVGPGIGRRRKADRTGTHEEGRDQDGTIVRGPHPGHPAMVCWEATRRFAVSAPQCGWISLSNWAPLGPLVADR